MLFANRSICTATHRWKLSRAPFLCYPSHRRPIMDSICSVFPSIFGENPMKISTFIIAICCITSLVACSSRQETRHTSRHVYSAPKEASSSHYGRVSDIEILSVESKTSGGGAVLGAVIGGVVGHQLGKGTGRDLATGAGAVGGAIAGNNVERRNGHDSDIYRVTVKFENGSRQQFDYEDINDLRVGDRVKVEGGQIERL